MKKINDIFRENITYVEYARSGIVYITESLEELNELVKLGWKYNANNEGFRIIPPEETIVDITDYRKAMQYGSPVFNLAYYDFIKSKIENNLLENFINSIIQANAFAYRGFDYLISSGPILDTEVRIAGSDYRIKNLKMDMVESFLKLPEYIWYMSSAEKEMPNIKSFKIHNKNFYNLGDKEKSFYNEIKEKIAILKDISPFNQKIYEIDDLEKIVNNPDIDIMLFLPFGCFKYLSSFTNEQNINKVMFWEFHSDNSKNSTFKLCSKDIRDKNVLIIDNIYSGKTLKKVKFQIEKEGGNPIILGMNPKNKNNILMTDYAIILNKLYKSSDINITEVDLFRKKYLEIMGGE